MKLFKALICKHFPSLIKGEEQLSGSWKSSLELTKKNNDFSSLSPKQVQFLNQVIGDLEITYLNEYSYLKSSDKKITIDNRLVDWKGDSGKTPVPYKVIRINNNEIYFIGKNPYGNNWLLDKYVFLSDSLYKVKSFRGIDEYFVKQ